MYIKVKVTPGAKRAGVARVNASTFNVSVKSKAEHGLANAEAHRLLAEHLKMDQKQMRLIAGHRSPSKIFSLRNLST